MDFFFLLDSDEAFYSTYLINLIDLLVCSYTDVLSYPSRLLYRCSNKPPF